MKKFLYQKYFTIVLTADDSLTVLERCKYLFSCVLTFAPVAIILSALGVWFETNKLFLCSIIVFIFINMILGGRMHWKSRTFSMKLLLQKTVEMIMVVGIVYLVLELILKVAGENVITSSFQATLQVATLLYPGGKILKNIFILSEGEHPPKWLMQKIYNFQNNGDLKEFMSLKKPQKVE